MYSGVEIDQYDTGVYSRLQILQQVTEAYRKLEILQYSRIHEHTAG
jgi:hypothetical protein